MDMALGNVFTVKPPIHNHSKLIETIESNTLTKNHPPPNYHPGR